MNNPFNLADGCFSLGGRDNNEIYFAADSYALVRVQADGEVAIEEELKPEHLYCLEIKGLPQSDIYIVMKALLLASEFARSRGISRLMDDFVHFG